MPKLSRPLTTRLQKDGGGGGGKRYTWSMMTWVTTFTRENHYFIRVCTMRFTMEQFLNPYSFSRVYTHFDYADRGKVRGCVCVRHDDVYPALIVFSCDISHTDWIEDLTSQRVRPTEDRLFFWYKNNGYRSTKIPVLFLLASMTRTVMIDVCKSHDESRIFRPFNIRTYPKFKRLLACRALVITKCWRHRGLNWYRKRKGWRIAKTLPLFAFK